MSEKTKETLKELLEWFPFFVLPRVAEHIFYEHALAGIIFTIVSMASFYFFIRVKIPEWTKKDAWVIVGFLTVLLFLTMVFNNL